MSAFYAGGVSSKIKTRGVSAYLKWTGPSALTELGRRSIGPIANASTGDLIRCS